jgi:hypothetical protein
MSDMQSLIRDLQSNKPDTRYAACEELRAMALYQPLPQEAVDVLNSATKDRNPAVADSAEQALALHTQISNPPEQRMEIGMNMFHSHPNLSKLLFSVLLFFTVAFSWLVRLSGAGWYLVFFGIPMLIMTFVYISNYVSAIVKIPLGKPWIMATSNLLFFLFFALQYDGADSADSTGTSLYFFMRSFGIELEWLKHSEISGFSILALVLLLVLWTELRTSTGKKASAQQK